MMEAESKLIAQLTVGKVLLSVFVIAATWMLLKWVRRLFERLEAHNPRVRFLANQLRLR